MGYNRKNGKVGVRNEIWIIPTVGCVNNVASKIAELSKDLVRENIEAVCAFPHPYGCSQMGDDQEHTRQILANLINHPNAGGVLVLGLGCENSNIDVLKGYMGEIDTDRVKFLVSQESDDEIAEGVEIVKGLAEYASQFHREPVSVSKLAAAVMDFPVLRQIRRLGVSRIFSSARRGQPFLRKCRRCLARKQF